MIKLVVVAAALVAATNAAHSFRSTISPAYTRIYTTPAPVTVSYIVNKYDYSYKTLNGISAEERGALVGFGENAAINVAGSYQYTSPEGVPVKITYLADKGGFRPYGDVIPKIPAAILRSIEYNKAHPETPSPRKNY